MCSLFAVLRDVHFRFVHYLPPRTSPWTGTACILRGKSPRGSHAHVVVALVDSSEAGGGDFAMHLDPHPSDSFIEGPGNWAGVLMKFEAGRWFFVDQRRCFFFLFLIELWCTYDPLLDRLGTDTVVAVVRLLIYVIFLKHFVFCAAAVCFRGSTGGDERIVALPELASMRSQPLRMEDVMGRPRSLCEHNQ